MSTFRTAPVPHGRLVRLADEFWTGVGGSPDFPRDPEPLIPLYVPVKVEPVPNLSCAAIAAWAAAHPALVVEALPDRPLRGCLITHAGRALLLVDPADPPDQRRFTIAHELGHFLVEVSEPRRRVRDSVGAGALEVLDGLRLPTVEERIHAVLAGAPLAAQVHLMARKEDGSIGCPRVADAECAADRFALELLAPVVSLRPSVLPLASLPRQQRWRIITARLTQYHGLPQIVASGYARDLVQDLTGGESVRERFGL
ncbi:MAG: ImmA/IrrE family metallo-endopeptidase [Dehalococcoidia bacterium]